MVRAQRLKGFTLIELMIVITIIAILAGILVPNFLKARSQGYLVACKSNCKNIATSLELYAGDNLGHYPPAGNFQSSLTSGNYLRNIPNCPATGRDTYSASFVSNSAPDGFSFYCSGNNHPKAYIGFSSSSAGFPQYNAESGLLDHP